MKILNNLFFKNTSKVSVSTSEFEKLCIKAEDRIAELDRIHAHPELYDAEIQKAIEEGKKAQPFLLATSLPQNLDEIFTTGNIGIQEIEMKLETNRVNSEFHNVTTIREEVVYPKNIVPRVPEKKPLCLYIKKSKPQKDANSVPEEQQQVIQPPWSMKRIAYIITHPRIPKFNSKTITSMFTVMVVKFKKIRWRGIVHYTRNVDPMDFYRKKQFKKH